MLWWYLIIYLYPIKKIQRKPKTSHIKAGRIPKICKKNWKFATNMQHPSHFVQSLPLCFDHLFEAWLYSTSKWPQFVSKLLILLDNFIFVFVKRKRWWFKSFTTKNCFWKEFQFKSTLNMFHRNHEVHEQRWQKCQIKFAVNPLITEVCTPQGGTFVIV